MILCAVNSDALAGWVFVFAAGVLCSLGIYIGRFLRWNSWDLFFHPLERLHDFMYYASHPSMQSIVFISVFSAFFIFFYVTLYAFGLLLQEQAPRIPQEIIRTMTNLIVLRGGGDLASGVALRLHRAGFQLVILELEKPLAVRRTVSFSEAVYEGTQTIEGTTARLVSPDQIQVTIEAGEIPVLIDPHANMLRNPFLTSPQSTFVVDARLLKTAPEPLGVNTPASYWTWTWVHRRRELPRCDRNPPRTHDGQSLLERFDSS